jgi:proteasome lid subunit RPN8/RPN11
LSLPTQIDDTLVAAHREAVAHSLAVTPDEAVGIIWADAVVTRMENDADQPGLVAVSPDKILEAIDRRIEDAEVPILSIYHSHPRGTAEPSNPDYANMLRWRDTGWDIAWSIIALTKFSAIMSTWKITDELNLIRVHRIRYDYPPRYAY